jgi:hypothetical protein
MPRIDPPSTNGDAVLTQALRLHALGYAIVPCDGKKAIVQGWADKRLTAKELTQALNGTKLNIAIALNRSDLIDVECDNPEAEPNLSRLFGGKIPPTPTWQSKRGKHRLFRRPPGLPVRAKLEIDGIEFRIGNGKGALSVVPPSVHPEGARYKWLPGLSIHEAKPAELPPRIVARLQAIPAAPLKPLSRNGDTREGERNDTLFKLACKLRDAGLASESVERMVLAENMARCNPPLPEDEVRGVVHSAMENGAQGAQTAAQILLGVATTETELWHTANGLTYATIRRDEHREHWPIRSGDFRRWLAKRFYDQKQNAVGSQTMQDTITTLEGKARFDGPEYPVFIRLAGHEDRIYIDVTDDAWRAIEVSPTGWRIVDDPPVRFRRAKGMLPLPVPKRGGSLADLRRFVNVTDKDWPLLAAWLVAAFRPTGPYPILKLIGEQGAAKTTTAEVLRKLVDPNTAPLRRPPHGDRDLMIAANNGWVVGFDNLSYVKPELSDALCCLATGGGYATRALYSDNDETILVAERPIILNGIEDIGTRSDLSDRSLMVELPRIEKSQRRPERLFWAEWEELYPQILGSLLTAVSTALKNLPVVEKSGTDWPRMADFAQWAVAAESSFGNAPGRFLEAYADNREMANQTALESSPVALALLALLKRRRTFEGTATELHNALAIGQDTRASGWPKNARVLSGMLNRLAPSLRTAGVTIEQAVDGSGDGKRKVWRIKAADDGARSKPGPNRKQTSPILRPVRPVRPSGPAERLRKGLQGSQG